jgi:hypothetical protein
VNHRNRGQGVTILRQDRRVPHSNVGIFPCTWL